MSWPGSALITKATGTGEMVHRFHVPKEWKGIGVVYVREKDGVVEISILYESHVPQAVKDELMARFGVGCHEWKVASR